MHAPLQPRNIYYYTHIKIFKKHMQDCVYLLCEGQEICEISGFCNGIHNVFALVSCYAAKVDRCIATFQETIWPHLQSQILKK